MKTIGRILLALLKGVLVAALLAAALVVALVGRPEWFLTPPRTRWAVSRFGAQYRPSWKTFELSVRSTGFLDKTISLYAEDFCFDAEARGASGCLPLVDVSLAIRLGLRPAFKLERLQRVVLDADRLTIDQAKLAAAKPAKKRKRRGPSLPSLVPRIARGMTVGIVEIRVKRLTVRRAGGSLTADASAAYPTRNGRLLVAARAVSRKGRASQTLSTSADLASDLFDKGRLTFLDAHGRAEGSAGIRASFDARLAQAGRGRVRLSGRALARTPTLTALISLTGHGSGQSYDAALEATVREATGPVKEVDLRDCRLDVALNERTGAPKQATLGCAVEAEPGAFGLKTSSASPIVDGRLDAAAGFTGSSFDARASAALAPRTSWKALTARLDVKASGDLDRLPESVRSDVDADFRIARFEDLVAFLKGTLYAVPAPLNALKGPLSASLSGSGDVEQLARGASYQAGADLAGSGQRLKLAAAGRFSAGREGSGRLVIRDTSTVDIQDVALDLPYLRIGPVPKVLVDSRIRTSGPPLEAPAIPDPPQASDPPPVSVRPSTGVALLYDATIATSRPIMLRCNLTQSPIPVSLELGAKPGELSGKILIGRFQAKLFRQTATIDHVTLTMRPGSTEAGLEGLVVYKRPEATIYIHLLGSTAKPQVSLSSDPPMTRDEITALLLYGQPPDALDEDQRANVGNASNGMATGAFGLASLYLFASTPIEYVGYDPATQTYAVRLKIPGGVHMELGSSSLQESRYLTLRKRLAPHWAVETQAAQSQVQGNAITTFLEWFERY